MKSVRETFHTIEICEKEEVELGPYYWVDSSGNIYCHCVGNPLALFTEKSQWKFDKPNRTAGKCCLFIPNIQ
jgi:hypothetical protein